VRSQLYVKTTADNFATVAVSVAAPPKVRWVALWTDLFKARLSTLVLITMAVGFYLGSTASIDWVLFAHAVAGTALLAAGAAALNQYVEREPDALMRRTAHRPLPSGQLAARTALLAGVATSVAGMAWLAIATTPLTAFLGSITLASYVFIYTPLKRYTTLNTLVGAVPGALPPLMGWTAATGRIDAGGWALFTILFFWQLPHFMAIAWIYREDYEQAGHRMLPVVDPEGIQTGASAVRHTLALLAFSLSPFVAGIVGRVYVLGALLLGIGFLVCAIAFSARMTMVAARRLFLASIIYLPLLLGLLVATKIKN
jgi:protoheme IX farnesyltransferase